VLDLLVPDTFRKYAAAPERLDVVHQLIERNKELQFILTGSSARKLKRTGVDLLAGRAIVKSMHRFMAAELGTGFDLDKALRIGLVPLVTEANNPSETLNSYIAIYLKEEVQMEGLVRNS